MGNYLIKTIVTYQIMNKIFITYLITNKTHVIH